MRSGTHGWSVGMVSWIGVPSPELCPRSFAAAASKRAAMRGSTFPAKKALDQSRRLGHDGVVQAFTLLAQADRDLRGERAYPREIADELVMEMLVARLANLSRLAR